MDAIQEGGIEIGIRQRIEEMRILEHIRNIVRRVADESKGGFRIHRSHTTGERVVRHVVLHDVHELLLRLLVAPGKFVERNAVPIADKSNLSRRIVDEELCQRDFATRQEHPVRRALRIDVRLARSLGSKLHEVVVPLDKRNKPQELEKLVPTPELLGIETNRLKERIDPFLGRHLLPRG